MKCKILTKFLAIASLGVLFAGGVGVYATWTYATGGVAEHAQELAIKLSEFEWKGSEELPDDVQGEDHYELINQVINSEYGLNTEGSYLNDQIDSRENRNRDTFGSVDLYDGSDIENLFDLNTSGLTFLLHFPENTPNEQYLFTTSVELGETGWLGWGSPANIPIGEYVYVIYRTKLVLSDTGKWEAVETKPGYAKSAYYENDWLGSVAAQTPCFDPDTWQEGKRGTGFSNAIYAFVGQTTSAYLDSDTEKTYYKVVPSSRRTVTITLGENDGHCSVNVYKANQATQNVTTSTTNGIKTVSFTASANATYYIELSGDKSIAFTIS
ncbi:MAG: hypothetical protein IJV83_04875 [Clostridia bacterium]|nr:hypothetical protein [Clostridia bacterium]